VVLRSFLGKNQGNAQRILSAAGEKFALTQDGETITEGEIPGLLGEIGELRREYSETGAALTAAREERRKIGEAFGAEGGPGKRLQTLERHILQTREALRDVYQRQGRLIEKRTAVDGESGLEAEDRLLLEKIRLLRESIAVCNGQIEKLKASMAIDEELGNIDKLERSIADHRRRISASERSIAELTRQIEGAQGHIEELEGRIQELDKLL
jgi:chromosome segregation ATPase